MIINRVIELIKATIWYPLVNRIGVLNYFGERVFFPSMSLDFRYSFRNGIYEYDNLRFILYLVKENSTYMDVGANIGLMSIPVLKKVNGVSVISVEANSETLKYLHKTHEVSGIGARWELLNFAASDVDGDIIELFVSSERNAPFASLRNTERVPFDQTIKVTSVTLDTIWKTRGCPEVSFIKFDVEGADIIALRGASDCIGKCRPCVLIEWNHINIKAFGLQDHDLIDWLIRHNYSCYALPSLNRIVNVTDLKLNVLFTESFLLSPN